MPFGKLLIKSLKSRGAMVGSRNKLRKSQAGSGFATESVFK